METKVKTFASQNKKTPPEDFTGNSWQALALHAEREGLGEKAVVDGFFT